LRFSSSIKVSDRLIVPYLSQDLGVFHDMPPVFATAFMIAFVEATCAEAVKPYLRDTQRTVGIYVEMTHSAASPVGMPVNAEVQLTDISERRLVFMVECRNEVGLIGQGQHHRAIVDLDSFLARLHKPRSKTWSKTAVEHS
jgi:fluoroacetyl-CoA thioesterase